MSQATAAVRQRALALFAAAACALVLPSVLSAQDTERDRAPVASPERSCPPPPPAAPEARGSIQGTVHDERTGLPLPDSRLLLSGPGHGEGLAGAVTFRTDGRGRYRLCRLPVGWTVTLRAEHRGLLGPTASIRIPSDAPVERDLEVYLGEPGALLGRVRDRESDETVSGAAVRVAGMSVETVTGDDGEFRLPDLPAGDYVIEVEHLAYGLRRDSVSVRSGTAVELALGVAPRALAMEPLVVTVDETRPIWLERTGFYRRRSRNVGIFFTREEILDEGHSRLSEVFRGLSGVRLRNGRVVMRRAPRSITSGGRACPVQHFIDGQAVTLAAGVDTYLPEDIAAIELYRGPSETPMEFDRRRAACGALVLWLRARRD
ncbi:MAG: carboxypeptidase regulatory-like domain-containing protein [Candidatus Palauibacterales bacterium]|nr:carboxypeptidase regulatory-like domain-containing protein [Candidatus Palauibacterales bacterium]